MTIIQNGIDVLLANPPAWKGQRIGLVTNNAACTAGFQPSRAALLKAGFNVVKLFSPEHGLDTTGADGHEMKGGVDILTGLPVTSLYGQQLAPGEEDMAGIDTMLFDVPDVGSRFYTYLWTMTYVMEACSAYKKLFLVLDRPNPISGRLDLAEGPLLDEAHCSSFIGRWQMPIRHSCTMGELATYFYGLHKLNGPFSIVGCRNWKRALFYPDWGISFVPTSPAIPCFESALLYPGLCLLEATNISEGRGTATPFRIAGAPWMDGMVVAEQFNGAGLDGACARPIHFTPAEGKYAGQSCKGIMLHVTDPARFRPVAAGWLLISIIKGLYPDSFDWAPYPTFVNSSGQQHMDLLTGMEGSQSLFGSGAANLAAIRGFTSAGDWSSKWADHILYY